MHKTIVIPTYWCGDDYEWGIRDSIYDHPTKIGTEGQLGRCLESITGRLPVDDYDIMIITAAANPGIAGKAERKVEEIIRPFRSRIDICQFCSGDLAFLKKRLDSLNRNPDVVSLDGYGHVRNCQLLGPNLLGSDLVIAIDDDEVVHDPALLEKIERAAGVEIGGTRVDGLSGFYVDGSGEDQLHEPEEARKAANVFLRKDALQNDAGAFLKNLPGEIVPTVVAYGGLMVFTKDLFTRVPHDPKIPRGEDIDYLINSSLYGYQWFFDKTLSIVHLPPGKSERGAHSSPSYSKLYQDVRRFLYTRAKVEEAAGVAGLKAPAAEDLGVYPGAFLHPELEKDSLEALCARRDVMEDAGLFPEPEAILSEAVEYAEAYRSSYFSFAEEWRDSCAALAEDPVSIEYMNKKMGRD